MANLQEQQLCFEYITTGLHLQMNNDDCLICNFQKHQDILQNIMKQEEKDNGLKIISSNERDQVQNELNDIDELEDAYDDLNIAKKGFENKEDNDEDEEEEESQEDKIIQQNKFFTDAKNFYAAKVAQLMKGQSGIEYILDNTMGFIINPNSMYGSRLDLARKVITVSLEQIQPGQVYNIFCTSQDLKMSATDVDGSNTDEADNFLENYIPLHSQKEGVISTLVSRIENSSEKISDIVVLTDYTKSEFSHQLKLVEAALQKKHDKVPRIHFVNLIIGGQEKKEIIESSLNFFTQVNLLSKGCLINFKK